MRCKTVGAGLAREGVLEGAKSFAGNRASTGRSYKVRGVSQVVTEPNEITDVQPSRPAPPYGPSARPAIRLPLGHQADLRDDCALHPGGSLRGRRGHRAQRLRALAG